MKLYLHSSMDRFEAGLLPSDRPHYLIYIPVWIDLKEINTIDIIGAEKFTFQYG